MRWIIWMEYCLLINWHKHKNIGAIDLFLKSEYMSLKWNITKESICAKDITMIWNKMKDSTFYQIAHTPLALWSIHKSWEKIVLCFSSHDYVVKWYRLKASWIIVRNNLASAENIAKILHAHNNTIALVSQISKKYLDKETRFQDYKSKIFCLISGKLWITNKFTNRKWAIQYIKMKK